MKYTSKGHKGVDSVFMAQIKGGKFIKISDFMD